MNAMSRRRFLKISTGAVGAATAAPALANVPRASWRLPGATGDIKVTPTYCDICFWKCGALAYTRDGEPRAGNPEKSLEAAVASAGKLRNVEGLRLTVILLEPDKRMYIDATKRYAEAGGGSIITTDPKNLAPELLIDYGL